MGLGVTGMANAGEMLGLPTLVRVYVWAENTLKMLRDEPTLPRHYLPKRRVHSLSTMQKTPTRRFIKTLPKKVRDLIKEHGIRNSPRHLSHQQAQSVLQQTMYLAASTPFSHYYDRTVQQFDGHQIERVEDYAYRQGP